MISFFEQDHVSQSDLVEEVRTFFSPESILARAKNFEYRPQQQQMAVAVAEALLGRNKLIVEGGTGVGKSMAYLVPAILYATQMRKKAIICTHTINLQEQLMFKDLPLLQKVLGVDFTYTMLKGRNNYLCTRRLQRAMTHAKHLFTTTEQRELERIYEWSQKTKDGTLSDFAEEPDPKVWAEVCSERGLCSPKLCGHDSDFAKDHDVCFYQRARKRIFNADVLVLNHSLFFVNLGMVPIPPVDGVLMKNDFVIFDEAHTLENVASKNIGISLSSGQFRYALNRLYNPNTQKGLFTSLLKPNEVPHVADALESGEKFFEAIEHACDSLQEDSGSKHKWSELRIRRPDLVENQVAQHLARVRDDIARVTDSNDDDQSNAELNDCSSRLLEIQNDIGDFLNQAAQEHVYWVERTFGGRLHRPQISLHAAPINVAEYLRQRLFSCDTSVIMTSATLSIGAEQNDEEEKIERSPRRSYRGGIRRVLPVGLDYIAGRLGAESANTLQVGSPFDYEKQMKLYLVNKMPDPRDEAYQSKLIEYIQHFIKQTHGKAFVLFTNNRLMQDAAAELEPFFEDLGIDLYVQGGGLPRSAMLNEFRKNTDSVLFGLDSFWQGVDVPGESLSNVIITRLPFVVPDHPLTEARLEMIQQRGGDPFMEYSLPEAILKFRQGIGRLIRTQSDHGIVVVLDNRLLNKFYGNAFLNAVPRCAVEVI